VLGSKVSLNFLTRGARTRNRDQSEGLIGLEISLGQRSTDDVKQPFSSSRSLFTVTQGKFYIVNRYLDMEGNLVQSPRLHETKGCEYHMTGRNDE
jgi:hypothetical protein